MAGKGLHALLEAQPHAKAVLGGVAAGRADLSHAYLITGPGGSGKRELAAELAAAILAAHSVDGPLPVDEVDDELRTRVSRGVHPDLVWIKPTSGAGILVEDVEQQILAAAGSTPLVASRRVFVLEQVDRLGPSSANRLLKTIEEPPPYVHLILLSGLPEQVLPTIASRCQQVRMAGVPESHVAARLQSTGVSAEVARAAAALAGGDADRAARLAGEGADLRVAVESFVVGALGGDVAGPGERLLTMATEAGVAASTLIGDQADDTREHLEGRDLKSFERAVEERSKRAARQARTAALDEALALSAIWLRDLWVMALGAGEVVRGSDRSAALHMALERIAPTADERLAAAPRLAEAVSAVEHARTALRVNASEGLLLDALAVQLAALGAGRPVPA